MIVGFALALYGLTEAIGAYGLLAVFAAGFTFRRYEYDHQVHHAAHLGTEAVGKSLELVVLLMLGSLVTTAGLSTPGLAGWLLIPVLLLIIRPALVCATVTGWVMPARHALFLGFFGVRGVAAIFYATVVVQAHVLHPHEQQVLVWATITCVLVSVIIHGLTADILTRRLLGPAAGPAAAQE